MERPVGISRDFLAEDGSGVWGDIGLGLLDERNIAWEYLDQSTPALTPDQIAGRPAVIFAEPAVAPSTFEGVESAPLVLARFGVGFDAVDLGACTEHGVAVTITPDGARRPVATAALTMLLATLHNLSAKERLTRTGAWSDRVRWMGTGLTGKTVGLVGLGNTSTDLVALLAPFQCEILAHDPYCPPDRAAALGVRLVGLDELAGSVDAVIVMAVLTDETRHMIDADFLRRMKPTAHLVNVSRGPLVDESALVEALQSGEIRGAALDVFEEEPLGLSSPLVQMDQVVLTPHSIAWTDEMSIGNGSSAIRAVLDVLDGKVPRFVVNREVLDSPAFTDRLGAVRQA